MKKLKVLVSAYACNPIGSLQLHPGEDITGWSLVQQLSRFHNLWVITHSYNREGVRKALAQETLPGVNFCFLNLPSWLKLFYKIEFGQRIYYYFWQIFAWKKARKLHRKFNFDVTHHITFGNDWMPSFIGAFFSIPFIWGPLGGGQKTPKGLMREYSFYGRFAEKVRDIAQWFGRNHYFRRRCIKKASAILVCNQETKEKFQGKYDKKIYFFPVNGISSNDLTSKLYNAEAQGVFRVLTAGRFHRLKGFALAVKSFHIFSKKISNYEFIIVGSGSEQDQLERLIQKLEIQSKVRIHPWASHEKLLKMMQSSDVFLFPSFRDGGGAVVVEAMACGRPVICLDSGGPGFHIRPEWGIKIVPKNPEYVIYEMAKALERFYLNKDLRKRMGEAARKRAEDYYLWDRLGKRLQLIYKEVLSVNSKQ